MNALFHPVKQILAACLLVMIGLTSGCGPKRFPQDTWVNIGPEGDFVSKMVMDPTRPNILYAVTIGGLFKSTDGAKKWKVLVDAPYSINDLVIDPKTPSTLYTVGDGIHKSLDGGGTWTRILAPLSDGSPLFALAIDPVTPTVMYTGHTAVMKTTDGGSSWNTFATGETGSTIAYILIDPQRPETLYASLNGRSDSPGGVIKSIDGGNTWKRTSQVLDENCARVMAFEPGNSSTLYTGWGCSKIFKSTNGGVSWVESTLSETYKSLSITGIAVDPGNPLKVYAATSMGLCKSTDGGRNFEVIAPDIISTYVETVLIDPRDTTTLYAGTVYAGVFKSEDGGGYWKASNAGLTATRVRSLALVPADPTILYAGMDTGVGGVMKSMDGGNSWERVSQKFLPSAKGPLHYTDVDQIGISVLVPDPRNRATLYAGVEYVGLFKSTDAGVTWTLLSELYETGFSAVLIDPSDPAVLYVGLRFYGIQKSTDGGENWVAVNEGLTSYDVYDLVVDPRSPSTLYVATFEDAFKSTDAGGHCMSITSSLREGKAPWVHALAIDPKDPANLYMATDKGIYKSQDEGISWKLLGSNPTRFEVEHLLIDPVNTSTIYATEGGAGIYKSIDAGMSWTRLNTGLTNTIVWDVLMDPRDPGTLYIATSGGGVFVIDQ